MILRPDGSPSRPVIAAIGMVSTLLAAAVAQTTHPAGRPNVVLIITDDQGYGDLSIHGNPHLATPTLDRIAREGVRFTQFHVSPVCSPTRASLMTGRYNFRTGAIDTYIGRSMMRPDEVTLAELLADAGYQTGIFGKWHLGDNYPMRAMDQGFAEALVFRGGGLAQPSDEPDGTYFDPYLYHNGRPTRGRGYCTDVFTDAALAFIERNRHGPFFVYLATNAPHDPLQVPEDYVRPFTDVGVEPDTARVYGMIVNIDRNAGRLLEALARWHLADNTILIFLTDNGPAGRPRFNAGMRGHKGTVYEGGIRVPFFVRWPARLRAGVTVDHIAAHIDVMPTILDACGVPVPKDLTLDGRSLLPLMDAAGGPEQPGWPERTLFFQWHRGDVPEPFRNCAVLTSRYKLVDGKELYDLRSDPAEQRDIAADHPDVVARLRAEYERWFRDVCAEGFDPPRIQIGTPRENPSVLTRQDWRGSKGYTDADLGWYEIRAAAGLYRITLRFPTTPAPEKAHLRIGPLTREMPVRPQITSCTFESITIPAGDCRLEAWIDSQGRQVGPRFVEVERVE